MTTSDQTIEDRVENEEADSSPIKKLRDQNTDLVTENNTLREQLRSQAFELAGIDKSEGPGKLLFESYSGEPTRDAVYEAAETYGIVAAPVQQASEATQAQAGFDNRLDEVQVASTPVTPENMADRIAAAENSGDMMTAVALKAQVAQELKE